MPTICFCHRVYNHLNPQGTQLFMQSTAGIHSKQTVSKISQSASHESLRSDRPRLLRAIREAADACSAGVIVGFRFVSLLEQSAHPAEAVEALHRSLAT